MSHKKKTIKTVFGLLKSKFKLLPGETSAVDAYGYFVWKNHYKDWGYETAQTVMNNRESQMAEKKPSAEKGKDLETGMLLTVFNTISKGDVAWSGVIDLEYKSLYKPCPSKLGPKVQQIFGRKVQGLQKGMDAKAWASMFFNQMPATLEREGKKIHGSLDLYSDVGMNGGMWSLTEFGKSGYDALNCLEKGDKLTVYSKVTDGRVAWRSNLSFKKVKNGLEGVEIKKEWGAEKVDRLPKGIKKGKWGQMFINRNPIKIELKK